MAHISRMTTMLCAIALGSGAWLGLVVSAQAAPVTDTFEVTLTGKQWCEGNPTFSESFKITVDSKQPAQNATLTVARDPFSTGDLTTVQATLNTQGDSPDLDAIPLKEGFSPVPRAVFLPSSLCMGLTLATLTAS